MTAQKFEALLPDSKIMTTAAIRYCKERGYPVTLMTLIGWCKKYKIGKQVGGRWFIDKNKLDTLLQGGNDNVCC